MHGKFFMGDKWEKYWLYAYPLWIPCVFLHTLPLNFSPIIYIIEGPTWPHNLFSQEEWTEGYSLSLESDYPLSLALSAEEERNWDRNQATH